MLLIRERERERARARACVHHAPRRRATGGAGAILAAIAELCERVAQLSDRGNTQVSDLGEPTARVLAEVRCGGFGDTTAVLVFRPASGESAG